MFTPINVTGGPNSKTRLLPCRLTKGKFRTGQSFEIQDYWCKPTHGHRILDEEWVGTTTFYNKPIESINGMSTNRLSSLTYATSTMTPTNDTTTFSSTTTCSSSMTTTTITKNDLTRTTRPGLTGQTGMTGQAKGGCGKKVGCGKKGGKTAERQQQ